MSGASGRRAALLLVGLAAAGCGVKGPPHPSGDAQAPPAERFAPPGPAAPPAAPAASSPAPPTPAAAPAAPAPERSP